MKLFSFDLCKKIRFSSYVLFIPCMHMLYSCISETDPATAAVKATAGEKAEISLHQAVLSPAIAEPPVCIPDSLSPVEYMHWLRSYRGVTYDEAENDRISLSILYKPLSLEAALSIEGPLTSSVLAEKEKQKKDFLYFEISYRDKVVSVNKTSSAESLETILKRSLLIESDGGVVYEPVIEFFSPALLNQPGKGLLLIRREYFSKNLAVIIQGKEFTLSDLSLRIPQALLKEFPKIKI